MKDLPSAAPLASLRNNLEAVIVGQHSLIEQLLTALLAGGHVLLEGPPGLAKTTVVHALANALDASFQRVQFTPDLMPADLIGSEIYEPETTRFRFLPGPIFNEILLADEINRAPPKVQSALLEAMAEHQVTAAGQTRRLPELFIVLATQNPLEQSGTYPLPEAQLDRFLFHILLDYPSLDEEIEITRRARQVEEGHVEGLVSAQMSPADLLALRKRVDAVFVEEHVERFAVQLVVATRDLGHWLPEHADLILAGASPRGSISLLRASMARAFLLGRDYVLPEDIVHLAPLVLRHRLVLDFAAQADQLSADDLIHALIKVLPLP